MFYESNGIPLYLRTLTWRAINHIRLTLLLAFLFSVCTSSNVALAFQATANQSKAFVGITAKEGNDDLGKVTTGELTFYENRRTCTGKKINLKYTVYHAIGDNPQPDPVFYLAGGPGQGAADVGNGYSGSWIRTDRDIVLVNQRGTGGDNRLAIAMFNDKDNVQQFLGPLFRFEEIAAAKDRLSKDFDLTQYSTPIAMDDLNDARQALGYDKINLIGGSYGTRASMVYIRRHGDTVRTATLNGVAPVEFTNPLYHAEAAQRALDMIFEEVETNELYNENFPGLRQKFYALMKEFDEGPVDVEIQIDGKKQTVQMDRETFAVALRVQMYYMDTSRKVPVFIWRAVNGNLRPFAESSIQRNRSIGNSIALGMLLSVTAAEDIARIDQSKIDELCDDTFVGDKRVREQIAACKIWPKSKLPDNYGEPIVSDVPTLILSGSIDPVTPPKWGEIVHKNLKNSVHVIAPAAHGVGGGCISRIQKRFLQSGNVEDLDVSCVKNLKLPPLYLPKENFENHP